MQIYQWNVIEKTHIEFKHKAQKTKTKNNVRIVIYIELKVSVVLDSVSQLTFEIFMRLTNGRSQLPVTNDKVNMNIKSASAKI